MIKFLKMGVILYGGCISEEGQERNYTKKNYWLNETVEINRQYCGLTVKHHKSETIQNCLYNFINSRCFFWNIIPELSCNFFFRWFRFMILGTAIVGAGF
jgi:hypothetical protein